VLPGGPSIWSGWEKLLIFSGACLVAVFVLYLLGMIDSLR
jgi:hypothetical protein